MGASEVGNADGTTCGEVLGTTSKTGTCVTSTGTGDLVAGGIVGTTLGIDVGEIGPLVGELDSDGDADGNDAASGALELVTLGISVGEKDPTGTGAAESVVGNADDGARVVGTNAIGVLEDGASDAGDLVKTLGISVGKKDPTGTGAAESVVGNADDGATEIGVLEDGACDAGAFVRTCVGFAVGIGALDIGAV